jgi:hypothetical protein
LDEMDLWNKEIESSEDDIGETVEFEEDEES